MKKLIFTLLSVILLATSCSLEKMPSGVVNSNDVQSIDDVAKLRNYLYIRLRGMYSGSYIYDGELMSDLFHASAGYGNRGGIYHKWQWTATESLAEGLWGHAYFTTASANFLIEQMDALSEKLELTDAQKAQMDVYYGEAYFMKAISMFELVKMFAEPYTKSPQALGVMLVDKYNPTSDASTYPGRSTVAETYEFIDKYLGLAATKLASVAGAKASMFLTTDAVTAMQARVALYKGDYQTAATKAASLVDGGKYPLISFVGIDPTAEGADKKVAKVVENFTELWTNDSGEECIMQLYADYAVSSVPSSIDPGYVSMNANGIYAPDYIPEQWIIDMYSDEDIRGAIWFEEHTLTYQSLTGNAVILTKFPGNRSLQDPSVTTSSHIQKIKPFRIAEQYLIAAEAYAALGNDEAAYDYYSKLVAARTLGFQGKAIEGDVLKKAIKDERVKELIGEGFRFYDLKRYGEGFVRTAAQNAEIITGAGSELTELMNCSATNFRWLWPIPQAEIDSNPQIAEQQNPGY